MKFTKNKFKIGDWVRYTRKLMIYYDTENNRNYEIIDGRMEFKGGVGQICGVSRRHFGYVVPASGGGFNPFTDEYDYESAYLKTEETLFFWKVAVGLLNKAIEVPEDGVELLSEEEIPKKGLPVMKQRSYVWEDKDREMMRVCAQVWPRDSKGRFLKDKTGEFNRIFLNELKKRGLQ